MVLIRNVLGLALTLAGTTLLSGFLITRACGGTALVVNGRVLDEESGAGLAGVRAYVSLGYERRMLVKNEDCGISGKDGLIQFEGPLRWTQIYGPVGRLKRRLARNRDCMPELTVELRRPGSMTETRVFSDDGVLATSENPYRVELGDVVLSPAGTKGGPKS